MMGTTFPVPTHVPSLTFSMLLVPRLIFMCVTPEGSFPQSWCFGLLDDLLLAWGLKFPPPALPLDTQHRFAPEMMDLLDFYSDYSTDEKRQAIQERVEEVQAIARQVNPEHVTPVVAPPSHQLYQSYQNARPIQVVGSEATIPIVAPASRNNCGRAVAISCCVVITCVIFVIFVVVMQSQRHS